MVAMLFDGYNIVTWMVVLKLGSTGLLVSWLMNYADNIVKLFLGIIVCIMSVHMYFAPPNMLVDLPVPVMAVPNDVVEVSIDGKTDI
ncbi:hypothetical protein DCAR_0209771 [Daucus carota subsp. sativus]|uniref:Uncharacterized protein n=1 Tax=Daucus carota subsp. sativus TaxID=79200 RepID=A0A166FIB8_DAUCS|nr:hypothetical protein DCAR_0209771 [Daucus carota subsp. sativus]